mmetsp:Transcript_21600/g.33161  ORF Transcript_21600/g.33161 Transcript_21600/m.33161 type:complete len:156 (+) Transcript_21600:651-1118(+)
MQIRLSNNGNSSFVTKKSSNHIITAAKAPPKISAGASTTTLSTTQTSNNTLDTCISDQQYVGGPGTWPEDTSSEKPHLSAYDELILGQIPETAPSMTRTQQQRASLPRQHSFGGHQQRIQFPSSPFGAAPKTINESHPTTTASFGIFGKNNSTSI